ncbi:MAG TPA: class I tRNA ligase family protein, partial [Steroidobacteraceae bacterium]|nr:class I tRNA ligase family protein [Steroidobacteraceae bacterium]
MRKILVTSALPYANGPLHLGHIIEAVQADIWVRLQKMLGHDCLYVCAEDAHGTPIMIRAQGESVSPEELIARVATEHARDYAGFLIGHDQFHSTHSPENRVLAESMYLRLRDAGYITRRPVRQAYDEKAGIGTVVSTMLPYTVVFFIGWVSHLIIWILFDLPLGFGAGLYLG